MNESFFASLKNYRFSNNSAFYGFGDRQSRSAGIGVEFEDYRKYVPGDDMRMLDWNVYSRLDHLYIKRHRSSGTLRVSVILDRSASMASDNQKYINAIKIASALGYVGLNNSDTVRLLPMPCLSENELQTFTSIKQLQSMINSLEKTKICKAEKHKKSLKFAYANNNNAALSLIITDFQEEQSWHTFIKFLRMNHQRVFVFHILSEKELELPENQNDISLGSIEFNEKQRIELTNSLKQAFLHKFGDYLRRTSAFMHANRVGYVKVSTKTTLNGSFWQKLKNYGLLS